MRAQQVCKTLNGFNAHFEFEGQTIALMYDIFFLNMLNRAVQEQNIFKFLQQNIQFGTTFDFV